MSRQPAMPPSRNAPEVREPVEAVIPPREHDLGAFTVRRLLSEPGQRMVGPFVLFDHMVPATLPADQPVNVRPHPHIGLATLTWLFEGSIMHRDSLGHAQEIHPGEVNWMTAGSGIVHSERTPDRLLGRENRLSGLQVWLALPKAHEETAPSFQHYAAEELPVVEGEGFRASVVAGSAWGRSAPVAVYSETLYVDMKLARGAAPVLGPEHEERAVYLLDGGIEIAGTAFGPGGMLVLTPGMPVELKALTETHLVLIGGAKIDGPRIRWWNLVSSSRDRIERAKEDWREGRFAKVPGDETEFIPLPDD